MEKKQQQQFNRMRAVLKAIAKDYQTPTQIERTCEKSYGLSYQEALEMSYENIQRAAADAIKGVRVIKEPG